MNSFFSGILNPYDVDGCYHQRIIAITSDTEQKCEKVGPKHLKKHMAAPQFSTDDIYISQEQGVCFHLNRSKRQEDSLRL